MTDIITWLRSRRLLGGMREFQDLSTWAAWLAFLKAFYGLPMNSAELALFRKHTGRQHPRVGGHPEAGVIVGRQSGKTAVGAAVGSYEAACAAQAKQRGVLVPLVAQDMRASQRAVLGYVKEAFEVPALRQEVTRQIADGLELRGGVSIMCYPCRPASWRGIRAAAAVLDELAYFLSTDGRPTDTEALRSIRPTLATTGGRLLILSSPYGQSGALWDLYRKHFGVEDSDTLVWQASAPDMNPLLPMDYLQRMAQDDPEAYRSEVLGEFRAGITSLFDAEALQACVDVDVRERLPQKGLDYKAFADPSGGRHDAFTVSVAHREGEQGVLDCCRGWSAPFDPASVVSEAAGLLRSYGLNRVQGDRYAAEFTVELFSRNGITYEASEKDRSQLYLELLPLVNSQEVRLLDIPALLRELRGLERRRGAAGKDRVDHRSGGSDDLANSCAGALSQVARQSVTLGPEHFFLATDRAQVTAAWATHTEASATTFGAMPWDSDSEPRIDYDGRGEAADRERGLAQWRARKGLA